MTFKKLMRWITCVSVLCLPARAAIGPGAGSYSINSLFDSADFVCWGRIASIADGSVRYGVNGAATLMRSIRFESARCYKGDVTQTDEIQSETHVPPVIPGDLSAKSGDTGLLFLKRDNGGYLRFADRFWGWLRDASLPLLAPETRSGLKQLEADLLLNIERAADSEMRVRDLRVLHGFDALSAEATRSVRAFAKDSEPRVALGAFSILAKAGRPEDLTSLCQYVVGGGSQVASASQEHSFGALETIRNERALPALECLARSAFRPLRLSAMEAIRGIGSRTSVPELVRALDDPDPLMQFLAVTALAEITHRSGEPAPLMPEFLKEPARFQNSWRRWWNETGHVLYKERGQ